MTPRQIATALFIATLLVTLLLPLPQSQAARNPFLPGGKPQQQRQAPASLPAFMPEWLLQSVVHWQLTLRAQMTALSRQLQQNPWGRSFWLFMLASLAYGAAHALGPGHGKAFAMAYFLERPSSWKTGLLFGNLSMFCHVLSAAALVYGGTYLLKTAAAGLVDDVGATLEGISYAMLGGIGLFMLGARLYSLRHRPEHTEQPPPAGNRALVGTALAAGLVPCPGASLVLLFCISLGVPLAGGFSLLAISLGMGTTISLFALATIASRATVLRLTHGRGRSFAIIHNAVSLAGGLLMAGLGTLLFLGWLWGA